MERKSGIQLTSGLVIVLAAPTRAVRQSPAKMDLAAWCIATIDEEQAVSRVIDGPLHPNAYDIRALRNARRVPIYPHK